MSVFRRARDACRFVSTYGQHFQLALPAIGDLRCRLQLIDGVLAGSGTALTVLYAGRGWNHPYLVKTLFESHTLREEHRTTLFGYRRRLRHWQDQADVIVVDIGWPYAGFINRRGDYLEVPDWIDMGVNLAGDWQTLCRGFRKDARKNDLRRVRRAGYRCETTSSRAELEHFYDAIYVPYVQFVHGADALVAPRFHVLRQGAKGALIKVLADEETVAAGVVYPDGEVLVSLWMGIPAHRHREPADASVSALYVFLLQYAVEQGYSAVDFAGTRAFLGDGVFRFKRKWGAVVEDSFSPSSILFRLVSASPQSLAFCRQFPLITRTARGLEGLLVSGSGVADTDTLRSLAQQMVIGGLERFVVLAPGNGRQDRALSASVDGVPVVCQAVDPGRIAELYSRRGLDGLPAGQAGKGPARAATPADESLPASGARRQTGTVP